MVAWGQSAESPQEVRERSTVATGPAPRSCRSDELCHRQPTVINYAGIVLDQRPPRGVTGTSTCDDLAMAAIPSPTGDLVLGHILEAAGLEFDDVLVIRHTYTPSGI